ncbi:MAG: hypothetical protein LBQ89_09815 [Treponema sp.]|nr:hypothetical protein [Treponema sp.]
MAASLNSSFPSQYPKLDLQYTTGLLFCRNVERFFIIANIVTGIPELFF